MGNMIFLIIIVILIVIIFILDIITTIDIANNMLVDEDGYNKEYIKALNYAIKYHEERLGRRLSKREYNKLKYKIFNDFCGSSNHTER